jgi:hypothetical protein
VRQKEVRTSIPQSGQKEKSGSFVERRTPQAGMNAIRKAAAAGQNVKLTLRFATVKGYGDKQPRKNADVNLFERGGANAQDLLDKLEAMEGSDASKFKQLVEEVLQAQEIEVSGFQSISVGLDVERPI